MKIATFNINGIKARLPRLIEWLEETRPAVACLQEIKTQDEGFPAGDFEAIGYSAIWHGQKSFNGVAILVDARAGYTLTEVQRGLGIPGPNEGDEEQARYLEADVSGVRVACLYLPNGNPHPGRSSPTSWRGWRSCASGWRRSGPRKCLRWYWAIST